MRGSLEFYTYMNFASVNHNAFVLDQTKLSFWWSDRPLQNPSKRRHNSTCAKCRLCVKLAT